MLVRMMVWDSSRKRRCSSGVRAIVFRRCMSRPLVRPADSGQPPEPEHLRRRHPGPPLFFPPASRYAGRMGQQIYKARIVDLRVERVTLPNGTAVDLELMHHPGASAVVAVDDGGRVVLIRQYRHAAGGYIWELPAGVLHAPGEPPRACAARELAEEAGGGGRALTHPGAVFSPPGFCRRGHPPFPARRAPPA